MVESVVIRLGCAMSWKEKLLTLDDLISLIGDTQIFFAERLNEADSVGRSTQVFLLGSLISTPLVTGIGREVGVPGPSHDQLIVSSLIYVILLAISALVAWRVVGIKHKLNTAVSAFLYCFGVVTPLAVLLASLIVAFIQKSGIGGTISLWVVFGLLVFWSLRVWRAFAKLKLHSRFQSLGALVIFLILAFLSSEIVSTVSTVMG